MFACTCHGFRAMKNEVPNLDWLQLHRSVMEMRDAELVKCFPKKGIPSDRGEEIKGVSKCYVV